MHQVLVLNASYEPLNVCSDRRAHVLVWKGKAEIVEHHAQPLRSAESLFMRPHVIRLLQYVRDEAHRFAQHYHHVLRKKSTLGDE